MLQHFFGADLFCQPSRPSVGVARRRLVIINTALDSLACPLRPPPPLNPLPPSCPLYTQVACSHLAVLTVRCVMVHHRESCVVCTLETIPRRVMMIIIMYIYHALIKALSAHMIHINLNMIFYTHVEHSRT